MSRKKKLVFTVVILLLTAAIISYFFLKNSQELIYSGSVPVTDYRSLPESQAELTKVIDQLDAPWGFDWLPNGDILITERFGQLKRVKSDTDESVLIKGLPEVLAQGQGGLLDVSVHPEFTENRFIYFAYSHGTEESNRLRVGRAQLNNAVLEGFEVIFEVAQSKTGAEHFGSRLQWLPDNSLLISVGDGGNPPIKYNGELIRQQAQSLKAHFGKVIRIQADGSVPNDNPFAGLPAVQQEIYSYGHRNIQGLTYHSSLDRVFASEHGSMGGDEINHIIPGENYGWPNASYSTEYGVTGELITPHLSLPEAQDPVAVFTPSIAPSGLVAYSGSRYAGRQGDLFLAAMLLRSNENITAYMSSPAGAVIRFKSHKTGKITPEARINVGKYRVRDIAQGPDGYLYVLTDTTDQIRQAGTNAGILWKVDSF